MAFDISSNPTIICPQTVSDRGVLTRASERACGTQARRAGPQLEAWGRSASGRRLRYQRYVDWTPQA
jgi:hypothetical protein